MPCNIISNLNQENHLNCPACKNVMIILEHEQVEIDYCSSCHGIWLDSGELELLLDEPAQAKSFLASFAKNPNPADKPRKCPICLKKMVEVRVGTVEPPLLIDECTRHHGLWFDKDELGQVIAAAGSDKVQKIQKWLTGMFGKKAKD
jgi:Zn-finger nucleic acid-binding protein